MDAMTISQEGQSSANPNCLSHIENMVISVQKLYSGGPPKFWNNQMDIKLIQQAWYDEKLYFIIIFNKLL